MQVVKTSFNLLWPAVASGVAFSGTGITLAVIRQQLKAMDKKLDLILDKDRKVAIDKLNEAMIALENENYLAAYETFQKYVKLCQLQYSWAVWQTAAGIC